MIKIATYNEARSLKHALVEFGIQVKPETFDMRTSGIYIPRYNGGYAKCPHQFDPITGVAQWYFFFRFENSNMADANVGEALDFSASQGVKRLAARIMATKKK